MKKLSLIFALLLLGGLAHAQNSALNIDDIAPVDSASPSTGWAWPPCFGLDCAGGSGVLVYQQATNAVTPTGVPEEVYVSSTTGMFGGQRLLYDAAPGDAPNSEIITVNVVQPSTNSFEATFTKSHAANVWISSFSQTIDNASPSLDGESMQLNNWGEAQSNLLWFYNNGAQDGASYFYGDQWFYLDANGNTGNALEFDMFQYLHTGSGGATQNTRFMWGGQCDLNHSLWDVWNSYTGSWIPTTLHCRPSVNSWHHLVVANHRVPGDTSCTSSYPCMHFDYLVLDGTLTTFNLSESAGPLPTGWGEQTGIQDQLDVGSAGSEQTEWVDEFNFYTRAAGAPFFTTASSTTISGSTAQTFTVAALGNPVATIGETGTLPAGFTFTNNGNGTATLAGTPTTTNGGLYPIQFSASNGVSPAASQNFNLTVNYSGATGAPYFTSATSTAFSGSTLQTFTVTAGGVPVPAITESGTLPAGFTFTNNGNGTASLAGTPMPNNGGLYTLQFTASNGVNPNASQSFSLSVDTLPVFTSPTSATFVEGVPSSFTVTASGYPAPLISLDAGTLPAGLSVSAGDVAVISGTPTAVGTTDLVFEALDAPYQIFQPFTLTVVSPTTLGPTPYTLNAVQPPTTSSNTNYAAWESVLASGNNLFTGATAIVADGCSNACSQTTYVDQGTSYPIPSWTAVDALMATYTSQGKKANDIAAGSIEGGNNNGTSLYVFTQNWADLLDTDGSGQYRGPVWTAGATYRTLQYVLANGYYWQMVATATLPGNPGTPTYGQGCIAGSSQPAFVHNSGPYTESATYACVWDEYTVTPGHAPPQDVICTTNFAGVNCFKITVTNIVGNGTTVTVTLGAPPTWPTSPAAQSIQIAGITNAGYTALNGTFTINGEGSNSVTFPSGTSYSSCNAACLAPSGTVTASGSHLLNINSQNATNAILASGLPVAYEAPYSAWRNYFCDQTIQHYNAGQLEGGYIVCGFEGGGEYSTFDTNQQPSFTQALFLSGINDMLISEAAQNPTMPLFGDMNAVGGDYTYTDIEAAMEVANSVGMRTNGLQVTDITNIICSQGVSSAYCSAISTPTPCDNPPSSASLGCTSGGFYRNAVTYPTFTGGKLSGQPSTLSLQTLNGSQPSNCQVASNTNFAIAGPLAPAAASADCPQGFIGLLPALVALRTTGLVNFNSGPIVTVQNAEIYTNGPASCALCSHYDSSAYPVGDMLFALDPAYSGTTYAQTSASVLGQVLPYDAAFALFLGAQTVFGGCPASGGSLCNTSTFSLGVAPPSPNFFAAYTGSAMVPWATVPSFGNLLKNNAVAYDTSYSLPPANFVGQLSPVIRCTDSTFEVGHPNISISAGLGGSGDAEQMWNANSTMLHLNDSGGRGLITSFDKLNLAVGCGTAVTAAQNLSTTGSSSVAYNFSGGTWDWTNWNLYYGGLGNNDTTSTQVMTYDFVELPINLDFTVGPLFADFVCGLPVNSSCATNAPAWAVSTSYQPGQYVSQTFTLPDWTAGATYTTSQLGTLIQPTVNNTCNGAFKLTAAGTSAISPEPTWSTGSVCTPASNGATTDGTAKWRDLGGPPTFVFQLTGPACTSGTSTTPFFNGGFPTLMTVTTESGGTGCVWTNVGPMVQPPWSSFAGISRNSTRMAAAFSSNSYGWDDDYVDYNADQGTGIFAMAYDNAANQYVLLNTGTGWESTTTCAGGTGYNCAGGTIAINPAGQAIELANGCGQFIHNMKGSGTEDYPVIAGQGAPFVTGTGCSTAKGNLYDWVPFQPFSPMATVQVYNTISNHWAMLDQTLVNVGAQTTGPPDDYNTGVFTKVLSALTPTATPLVSWQPNCTLTYSVPPPSALPPCNFALAYDSHLSPAYNPGGTDNGFICGSIYNYADLASPPEAPWQGEEACISISPTWADGATPNAAQTQYRFTHSWNTGGNSDFNIQFTISQWSSDGQFLAFGTDGNCQFGGTDGSTNPPCGPPWAPGQTYALNAYINPFSSTTGSGTNDGVWQIAIAGTSAATAPNWSSCSFVPGCSVTDTNGVKYTYIGANKSVGAVLIVQLVPVVH